MNISTEEIGIKLASALLLQYGELPVEDIRAMPFLTQPGESEVIIRKLLELFNVEIYSRKVLSYPLPVWEEVIRIKAQ